MDIIRGHRYAEVVEEKEGNNVYTYGNSKGREDHSNTGVKKRSLSGILRYEDVQERESIKHG